MVVAGYSMTKAETEVVSGVIWATAATGRKRVGSTRENAKKNIKCSGNICLQ